MAKTDEIIAQDRNPLAEIPGAQRIPKGAHFAAAMRVFSSSILGRVKEFPAETGR
jgi:hypothetical protein